MRVLRGLFCSVLTAALVSACGTSGGAYSSGADYATDRSENNAVRVSQKTKVSVETPVKGENTNFDEYRAEWLGEDVGKKAIKAYRQTRGDIACGEVDVSALGVVAQESTEDKGRWTEDWRADICDVSYRFSVAGKTSFLGEANYEIGEPMIIAAKRPAPVVAAAPAPVAEAAPVAVTAPTLASAAPVTPSQTAAPAAATAPALASVAPATLKAAPKPLEEAGDPNDPRLQLLPLSLRRVVARMNKDEQELYFRQYTE